MYRVCHGPWICQYCSMDHHYLGTSFLCVNPLASHSRTEFQLPLCQLLIASWEGMGQIPGHSQPQVPESWEVNDLQPHGAHSETAQPGLAAVLLFSFFFSFGLHFAELRWEGEGLSMSGIQGQQVAQRFLRPKSCGAVELLDPAEGGEVLFQSIP